MQCRSSQYDRRKTRPFGRITRLMAVFCAVWMLLLLTEPLQAYAAAKPSITKQPFEQQVLQGKTATFQVKAKGGSLKYQWYIKLPGGSWEKLTVASARTARLKLTAKEVNDGAQLRCKVTNRKGTVYSRTVTLTVITFTKKNVKLDLNWQYARGSAIHSGSAVLYSAKKDRKGIVVGVNAGHGTKGGSDVKTWCHPDHSAKVTGGTTAKGATKAYAVSSGMNFRDGTVEAKITLKVAQYLKELLLAEGFDVLMLRDSADIQLDNVARTVICNNVADCHIAIHYDDDGYRYDKGAYYLSVPDGLKRMAPVSAHWREHEALGKALIKGLKQSGYKIWEDGSLDMDLTQTSYSTVPSVDIELGNQCSAHTNSACRKAAKALLKGIDEYFSK